MQQAFQLAGAEGVVATVWQIPDGQSAQLMVGFVDHLTEKLPRDEALFIWSRSRIVGTVLVPPIRIFGRFHIDRQVK